MSAPRTGQCLCGAVRFSAAEIGNFGVCHCRTCQRWTGSALFGVTVPAAAMRIDGAENVVTYVSSSWATRSHCGTCGSPLWYRYDPKKDGGGSYEVPIGLLDDTSGLPLQREIFIDTKPESYALAGEHPRLTEAEVTALYAGNQASNPEGA
ncbi:GFA family protein [Frigidibacter sp. ROC022]|uniref:GFA family protein n=1 Tax=Frigidibacter sp. ROC022 TaxID=2971796 RepID=UPI00215AC5A9|nr:GFA family protein [Frigidibacter sp. ROC022]MCR8724593.1 GFA family protein [Frigidibacter sp. ROC022]